VYYFSAEKEIVIHGSIASIEIYQLTGEKIYSQRISSDNLNIPASNWNKGICLVRVISQNGESTTRKILIN